MKKFKLLSQCLFPVPRKTDSDAYFPFFSLEMIESGDRVSVTFLNAETKEDETTTEGKMVGEGDRRFT